MINANGFITLADKVYLGLRDKILDGELAPGARLVRRQIGKQFGVSPIPVMEALWRLEQDGLATSEPMFGARVVVLSPESVHDELVMREAIECQAARLCAEKATEAELDDLMGKAEILDHFQQLRQEDSKEGMRRHLEFHLEIARCSRCVLLEQELQRVGYREFMRVNWVSSALYPVPADWHQQLVAVLRQRDRDQAEAKMREHVRYGAEYQIEAARKLAQSQQAG